MEEDGATYHCMKLEAEVLCPLFHFASMLYEMDLYPTWIPSVWGLGMSQCIVDHYDTLAMNTKMQFSLPPLVMSDREVDMSVHIFDYFDETGKTFITLESRDSEPTDGFVACRLLRSGVVIEPRQERSKMTMLIRVDPNVAIVPDWLIDAAFKHFARSILVMIIDATIITKSTEFHRRMTDPSNPFYAFLRRRIAEALPSQLVHIPNVAKAA